MLKTCFAITLATALALTLSRQRWVHRIARSTEFLPNAIEMP
jgi:ABC-type sugar transport system permease subunit